MNTETIILIGPEGAGKSTIGRVLAQTLSKELYSLDRHRDELYAPYDYDKAHATKLYEEHGSDTLLKYWKYFEFQATSSILRNAQKPGDTFYNKILDFGAGHSVYEDAEQLKEIESLIKYYSNVLLILPCEDVDEAVRITEARRGHQLEYNRLFMTHDSNARLARHVIYTKDKTPEENSNEIIGCIDSQSTIS